MLIRLLLFCLFWCVLSPPSVAVSAECHTYTSEDKKTRGTACRDDDGKWTIKSAIPVAEDQEQAIEPNSIKDIVSGKLVDSYIGDNSERTYYTTYYSPDGRLLSLEQEGSSTELSVGEWWQTQESQLCVRLKKQTCMNVSFLGNGSVVFLSQEWVERTTRFQSIDKSKYQQIYSAMFKIQNEQRNNQIASDILDVCLNNDFLSCLVIGSLVAQSAEQATPVLVSSTKDDECYNKCERFLDMPWKTSDLGGSYYSGCWRRCMGYID